MIEPDRMDMTAGFTDFALVCLAVVLLLSIAAAEWCISTIPDTCSEPSRHGRVVLITNYSAIAGGYRNTVVVPSGYEVLGPSEEKP